MFEALLTSIAVGTVWFWVILTFASICIIACIENEHYPIPSIFVGILGMIYLKSIMAVPVSLLAIFIATFAILGAAWSVFKWFKFVNSQSKSYMEKYGATLTEGQMADLKGEISVSNNKSHIIGWMVFWPWSLLWTLTGDFFNTIYDTLANVYQRITDRSVGKFTVKGHEPRQVITNDTRSLRR
jgi:hypothetical protein